MKDKPEVKDRIIHRLKIAKGHLNKVIEMVENDAYCIDVIHQSQAIQKALKEIDFLALENHLKTCAVDHAHHGHAESSAEEIIKVFKQGYR